MHTDLKNTCDNLNPISDQTNWLYKTIYQTFKVRTFLDHVRYYYYYKCVLFIVIGITES